MSGLILPNEWTSQPQVPVEIDWGNPLVQALGLVDVWIPSTGLLTPTLIRKFTPVVSVGDFSLGVNTSGKSLKYSAVTANNGLILANDADELFPVANTASIFCIRQSLDTTARTSTLFGYHVGTTGPDRTLAHVPYSDGNIYWDLGDTTTSTRLSVASGGKTTNKEAYAFIGGPTKGREIWRNGIKLAGDATKTGARAATTASFRIGSSSSPTTEANDLEGVNLFIIGSKEWPDWAIKALSDNPWQIFKAPAKRIWVAGAGSGIAGALAATESGSDTFASSGKVTVKGSLAAQETGTDTSAIAGDVIVQGALSVSETGSDTFAGTGKVIVAGQLAAQEVGADTAAMSGAVLVKGALAASESGADTFSAFGSTTGALIGAMAASESGGDSFLASGTISVAVVKKGSGGVRRNWALFDDRLEIHGKATATESGQDGFRAYGHLMPVAIRGSLVASEAGADGCNARGRTLVYHGSGLITTQSQPISRYRATLIRSSRPGISLEEKQPCGRDEMCSWIKPMMAHRAALAEEQQAQALKVQRVLLEQARLAQTVQQVVQQMVLLEHLVARWQPEVVKELQAAPTTGFPRSTASPKPTAHSTSKRRRAR